MIIVSKKLPSLFIVAVAVLLTWLQQLDRVQSSLTVKRRSHEHHHLKNHKRQSSSTDAIDPFDIRRYALAASRGTPQFQNRDPSCLKSSNPANSNIFTEGLPRGTMDCCNKNGMYWNAPSKTGKQSQVNLVGYCSCGVGAFFNTRTNTCQTAYDLQSLPEMSIGKMSMKLKDDPTTCKAYHGEAGIYTASLSHFEDNQGERGQPHSYTDPNIVYFACDGIAAGKAMPSDSSKYQFWNCLGGLSMQDYIASTPSAQGANWQPQVVDFLTVFPMGQCGCVNMKEPNWKQIKSQRCLLNKELATEASIVTALKYWKAACLSAGGIPSKALQPPPGAQSGQGSNSDEQVCPIV
ncbi:hypothetical protein IE53DRAFT_385549 [Violaceomyces palustris]|uniref:Uncharacterized protein n=1 Tax=Violaceomyces palustris TaxID=1673888 RepID=A0ACD0P1V6_9BASI|nr:hypothetical protein IE53DRAFT_385549 [Violaceomyces palustris]